MDIKQYTIRPHLSVKEAIEAIDNIGKKVVLITNETGKLLGIFTDGDMRRYILRNGDLSVPIDRVMNRSPVIFREHDEVRTYQIKNKMIVYPIVDGSKRLIDVLFWNDSEAVKKPSQSLQEIPVVIMAGGKGTRLYPYTKILPKPLIPIGDLTITERIIEQFRIYGCEEFHFVLNHKAGMIKAYFNELDKKYRINYVEEQEFLGTGGGLSLLKDSIQTTFFVSNCDTIIDADYSHIYKFHKQHQNKITMICALRNITVPYGVIALNEAGDIKEMMEKPSFPFLTNTGLYLLEPEIIQQIKEGTFIHLTDVIKKYLDKGERVGVYPVSEKAWLDMGQVEELETMLQTLGVK